MAKRFFSTIDAPSAGVQLTVAQGNALEANVLGAMGLLFDELDEIVNRLSWVGLRLPLTTAVVLSGVVVALALRRGIPL